MVWLCEMVGWENVWNSQLLAGHSRQHVAQRNRLKATLWRSDSLCLTNYITATFTLNFEPRT